MDLEVRMLGRRAGTLWVEQHEGLAFRYDTDYLAAPWAQALGQQLPLQAEPFPAAVAHRWFSGLLPEGERRESVARQLGLHHADTPGLLAAIGAECAGAVEIGRPEERDRRTPRAVPATREAISEELLTLPAMPLGTPGRSAKLSLAGVQKKLALVRDRSGAWHFPLDGYPSTHIIKPESDRFDALVDNEHTCLEIARRSALRTARSHVETFGTERCLVVERFDRTPTGDRIHQEDFAQALGTRIKYQNEGGPGLHTYFSHLPVAGWDLWDQVVFSWLIGDEDAHAKNFSIQYSPGSRPRLAPIYDAVCTRRYAELDRRMAWRIGDAWELDRVTGLGLEDTARRCGLAMKQAIDRAHRLAQRVRDAMDALENGREHAHAVRTLRTLGGIERRCERGLRVGHALSETDREAREWANQWARPAPPPPRTLAEVVADTPPRRGSDARAKLPPGPLTGHTPTLRECLGEYDAPPRRRRTGHKHRSSQDPRVRRTATWSSKQSGAQRHAPPAPATVPIRPRAHRPAGTTRLRGGSAHAALAVRRAPRTARRMGPLREGASGERLRGRARAAARADPANARQAGIELRRHGRTTTDGRPLHGMGDTIAATNIERGVRDHRVDPPHTGRRGRRRMGVRSVQLVRVRTRAAPLRRRRRRLRAEPVAEHQVPRRVGHGGTAARPVATVKRTMFTPSVAKCWRAVQPLLDEHLPGRHTLGGGTWLGAQWKHRHSTDLDYRIEPGSWIEDRCEPGAALDRALLALGARCRAKTPQQVVYAWPEEGTKLDLFEAPPRLARPVRHARIEHRRVRVADNAQIIAGKLQGRSIPAPVRDLYDVAVAAHQDRPALQDAANSLPQWQLDELGRQLRLSRENYLKLARKELEGVPARYEAIRQDPAGRALAALRAVVHRAVRVRWSATHPRQARVEIETASGQVRSGQWRDDEEAVRRDIEELGVWSNHRDARQRQSRLALEQAWTRGDSEVLTLKEAGTIWTTPQREHGRNAPRPAPPPD